MKRFTKTVFDGLRSSVQATSKQEVEEIQVVETLQADAFQIAKTVRHGFPYQPTAIAFDPIQRIIAVGTKQGSIRIIGRPGVDVHVRHDGDAAVLALAFLINDGALVSATGDDALHMWTLRQKTPQILHSLKFQRERITTLHVPFQSKWLYLGTERGNIHIVKIVTFELSGYCINWNKAIELSRKTHPGAVVHLSENPVDPGKLLIGYESGQLVLWDFKGRCADLRYQAAEPLRSVSWHHEGKQFMCCHTDGSLTTWTLKQASPRPTSTVFPHAKTNKEGKQEACKPIQKVEWKNCKNGDSFVVFSGGLAVERTGRTPSITVVQGKTTTVLEMEHNVVDFTTLCENPYASELSDPYALVVLLHNDLVVVDLLTPGYPCFENPYSMDIHEAPVTCCTYLADCPADLTPALYSAGARGGGHRKQGFSDKEWPISGGEWGSTSCPYPEMILTGHADGSIKFWDASSVGLQILYKLKTAKVFEKPRTRSIDGEEDPFAIHHLYLCPESRLLAVAGATAHVLLFRFTKQETTAEIPCLEVPIIYEVYESRDGSPEYDFCPRASLQTSVDYFVPIHVRGGPQRRPAGYQVELACLTPWVDGEPPGGITTLAINSSYGLLAYGNESGLVIVDYLARTCLLSMGTPDLYGSADPYQRVPRSPKRGGGGGGGEEDRCKSPASDQIEFGSSTFYLQLEEKKEEEEEKEKGEGEREEEEEEEGVEIGVEATEEVIKEEEEEGEEEEEEEEDSNKTQEENEQKKKQEKEKEEEEKKKEEEENEKKKKEEEEEEEKKKKRKFDGSKIMRRFFSFKSEKKEDEEEEEKEEEEEEEGSSGNQKGENSKCQEKDSAKTSVHKESGPKTSLPEQNSAKTSVHKESSPKTSLPEQNSAKTSVHKESGPKTSLPEQNSAKTSVHKESGPKTSLPEQNSAKTSVPRQNNAKMTTQKEDGAKTSLHEQDGAKTSVRSQDSAKMSEVSADKSDLTLFDPSGQPTRPPRRRQKGAPTSTDSTPTQKVSTPSLPPPPFSPLPPTPSSSSSSSMAALRSWFLYKKDKLDGSFSRSRSSSISSLENISSEAIQCLAFADTYIRKNEGVINPTLWVGTSLGSVIQITLLLPPADIRSTTPASVHPSGTIFRVKGSVLTMSFLDCTGTLIPHQFESWRDAQKERKTDRTPPKSAMVAGTDSRMSPTNSGSGTAGTDSGGSQTPPPNSWSERQLMVIASEKVARVVSLPTQNCVFKQILTDVSFVVKADVVTIKDSISLVCYIASGHISIFSLPSLRQLIYVDFLPLVDFRIARTFCFTHRGHGLYLCSPSEVQKFTISADFCNELQELLGNLFLPVDMPEAPKQSFFRGLFGGGVNQLDREELFGESSGKPSRTLAKHVAGPSGLDPAALSARAGAATSDIGRAKLLAQERGQKLGELEERTQRMMLESETFASHAHSLMMKYRDKKWYQL